MSLQPRLPEAERIRIPLAQGVAALALLAALLLAAPAGAADAEFGQLLVAKEHMSDPRFRETVILVTRHAGQGTVGVVLNRPSGIVLSDIFPKVDSLSERSDVVYFGGPMSRDFMVLLFRSPEVPEHSLKVGDELYLSTDAALLEKRLRKSESDKDTRVFLGYAGWAPGQLEAEITRGDWYTTEADVKTIFEKDPKRIWRDLSFGLGGQAI
ncbi:MAG: YqgE/AlgH family protein [Deltaproteobacteria bacterium]|nr:YqgE/AlgH family protein [Deltaproteobacteria bacterium]MBW2418916.1 YqgE/AlgH family protein [Deltaproteobacteria bacterium]